ncbi:uncharacterized protein LOC129750000 [Uranotaenia lowii]|uniref:uncharacterized protein LOC129750000 n=1 Tax=Uranotaenia lowii TaxID=190385 RepID=UPI0024796058|nr:uncharacterized protein LOC129750000 [Uranotaenia lowii]
MMVPEDGKVVGMSNRCRDMEPKTIALAAQPISAHRGQIKLIPKSGTGRNVAFRMHDENQEGQIDEMDHPRGTKRVRVESEDEPFYGFEEKHNSGIQNKDSTGPGTSDQTVTATLQLRRSQRVKKKKIDNSFVYHK